MKLSMLEHAAVGAPITRVGISLFPVYLHQPAGQRIVTGPASGIVISERPDAEVPTLSATAFAATPTLLVEGEALIGGQQHRTLNVSVLIEAGATVDLPVSCIEQGRWGGGSRFDSSRSFTSRRVRRSKHQSTSRNLDAKLGRHADQGEVWNAVAFELDRLGAHNESGSLIGADAALERDDLLAGAAADLAARGPLPGQCGVVISHGYRVVAAEVFAEPDLLASHWEALVRGILLDAPAEISGRPSANRALRFLRRVARGEAVENEAVGLGREHHLRTERVVAQGLTWDDRLVHASAFALAR